MDAEKPVVITDVPVMENFPETDANPEVEVLATPTVAGFPFFSWWSHHAYSKVTSFLMFWCLGEVMADAEKSKAAKKRALKAPWAKLLSQYSQVGD